MEAREIKGTVYRVKTPYGGLMVEIPGGNDEMGTLARYCAALSMKGYVISSVTRVFTLDAATPRIPVLSSKEYKAEIKRLMEEKDQ